MLAAIQSLRKKLTRGSGGVGRPAVREGVELVAVDDHADVGPGGRDVVLVGGVLVLDDVDHGFSETLRWISLHRGVFWYSSRIDRRAAVQSRSKVAQSELVG